MERIKSRFRRKKHRDGDRRKSNSEKSEDNTDKPKEPRPGCSTQEERSNGKVSKEDADCGPSSSACGDHACESGQPKNEKEIDEEKENKGKKIDNEPLERPDHKEDCENRRSENERSRISLSSSAEDMKRESISEDNPGNLASENESLDESLGPMVTDHEKQLSGQDISEANNELIVQDNVSYQSKAAVKSLEEVQIPDEPESTREAQEHSLQQVHGQEEAREQSKNEPLLSDILSSKEIEDRISLKLDQGSRVLANWEHLACELGAPPHIKAQCRRTTNESPTELLFESLKSWRQTEKLTVNQLIGLLREMKRKDAVEVIENAIPANRRENYVSNEITKNQDLLEELGTKLDKESRVLKNWRHLGLKLEVKREILQEIGNGNSPNAVEELFQYIYSTMPDLTVEEFKEKMEKINRKDVIDLFIDTDSGKMKEVVPLHNDLMCSICYMLNKSSPALKNWRHLASELGIDYNTYKSFEPEAPQSPTSILLEWACYGYEKQTKEGDSTQFTVREFCKILKKMKRYDVIEVLEKECGQNFRQPKQS